MTKPRPSTAAFETAVERASTQQYVLHLYIAGTTPASSRSVENLRAICDEHLSGRYELVVVDVFQQPELAKDAQIIAIPTLIKHFPKPVRRLVGDISSENRVLAGLNLKPKQNGESSKPASTR